MLTHELLDATFVKARSILEWRFRPDRLIQLAADFVLRCWASRAAARPTRRRRTTS